MYKEEFRKSLPIYQHREEILNLIKNNNYCIITGETGSGKTTQLPQYIIESLTLADFFKNDKVFQKSKKSPRVVITQPRRVAAIQMAKRVCYEKNYKLGNEIGYTIRFGDNSCENTIIKYVTDGILVKECLADNILNKYHVVIIDEAHERSLYSDILFALIKQVVKIRNGSLKLIIMSATLNTEQFIKYFNNCPLLKVSGKLYPVDITYHPSPMDKRVKSSVELAIRIHLHEGPGHILAFLTGFEECEKACKMTFNILEDLSKKGKKVPPMNIMPLYGAQNTEDQSKIFEKTKNGCRKLIFCTNIAETSLTVDGIGYVIDCGYVKQKIYNHKTSMDSLMIVPISKVQAKQRSGRAGRTGPGKCLRIYTEQFYKNSMTDIIVPEILRVNLASTILTLKSMGIDNIIDFDFMDKPDSNSIYEALKQLFFLQAIDIDGHITNLGKEMTKFPLDCCYSRALIASNFFNVKNEMEILVSLISSENVFVNVNKYDEDRRAYFEKTKNEFIDKYSDHITLLNIYKELEFHNFDEEWCQKHFLHIRALRQTRNILEQIKTYMNNINLRECEKFYNIFYIKNLREGIENDSSLDDYEKINCLVRMSLCQGFYMNAARIMNNSIDGLGYIRISDGISVTLDRFSSIALKNLKCDYVIFTELSGTISKPVMKQVSSVELKWINDLLIYLKNADIRKLKGENIDFEQIDKEEEEAIDLYNILDIKKEENDKDDDKEELEKKIKEARERYLQRKRKNK
jgi:ATP-dependent RNA helicase DHX8/PRP22